MAFVTYWMEIPCVIKTDEVKRIAGLVAGLGLEPRQTDPESVVLPLHYPAKMIENLSFFILKSSTTQARDDNEATSYTARGGYQGAGSDNPGGPSAAAIAKRA